MKKKCWKIRQIAFVIDYLIFIGYFSLSLSPTVHTIFKLVIISNFKFNSGSIYFADIVYIQFKRPNSFRFRSGQWVRISCPAFSCTFNELHAFSLASAPQASTLELYIKAVGPWTWNLRNQIACANSNGTLYPLLHLHGPYGDGNQVYLR